MAALLAVLPATAWAFITGIQGTASGTTKTFNLRAMDGWITMGDGTQAYIWGYADATPGRMVDLPGGTVGGFGPTALAANPLPFGAQYPGPTIIVNQGDTVVVHLTNAIPTLPGNTPAIISIVFPGQVVTATGGSAGLLTQEIAPLGAVTYTFTATNPGTYIYYSGTSSWLQQEMGLWGTLIVRPKNLPAGLTLPGNAAAPNRGYAYPVSNAYYDHEYLIATSEIDPNVHALVQSGQMALVDNTTYHPTAWFLNGRNYPDTVSPNYAGWLPAQPYGCLPQGHPLESILMRIVGGGRGLHPFHTHGQNHNVIARDGRLLQSSPAAVLNGKPIADMPISDYTTTTVAGETADAVWGPWTGFKMGWDVFGPAAGVDPNIPAHTCVTTGSGPLTALITFLGLNGAQWAPGFDPNTGEWCGDHTNVVSGVDQKQIPVDIPAPSRLSFGIEYGGTPYIGIPGELPPILDPHTGDYNMTQDPLAGLTFMWHSHSEREITTNNIFIGGIATHFQLLSYKNSTGAPINIP
jgi:FtsP/CotA-like multicopper oxidase with cupredoxin domain